MKTTDQLIHSAYADLTSCATIESLEKIRIKYFGKNGSVTELLKQLSSLSVEEKKEVGKKLNSFKSDFFVRLEKIKFDLEKKTIDEKLQKEKIDITLPARDENLLEAKIHPISHTINEIISIFGAMGLKYQEGPDIENDFYNFSALNIPKNHPARQMHDTFYVDSKKGSEYTRNRSDQPGQNWRVGPKRLIPMPQLDSTPSHPLRQKSPQPPWHRSYQHWSSLPRLI